MSINTKYNARHRFVLFLSFSSQIFVIVRALFTASIRKCITASHYFERCWCATTHRFGWISFLLRFASSPFETIDGKKIQIMTIKSDPMHTENGIRIDKRIYHSSPKAIKTPQWKQESTDKYNQKKSLRVSQSFIKTISFLTFFSSSFFMLLLLFFSWMSSIDWRRVWAFALWRLFVAGRLNTLK